MQLPRDITPAEFDQRYRHAFDAWRPAIEELALRHGLRCNTIEPCAGGSNLVAAVDQRWIVKLFPPFHRHQWESERRVLPRFAGTLPVSVPELVASGELEDGYAYAIITRLGGESLESSWRRYTRIERASLMSQIGETMAAAHAVEVGDLDDLPPRWPDFLRRQIAGCRERHTRLGMPAWIVDRVDEFVADALPALPLEGARVILTGEYTPSNLLVEETRAGPRLTGMIDFGDAMIGPAIYDLLGPASFLACGDPLLLRNLIEHHGQLDWPIRAPMRRGLLALLCLHRYSNLDIQIRGIDWRTRTGTLDALALAIWPD